MAKTRPGMLLTPFIVVTALLSLGIGGYFEWRKDWRASNERTASTSLKTISTAEAEFRANDRDLNQINDFWTGDVAGLYYVKANGQEIHLIDRLLAEADASPLQALCHPPRPLHGYFFVAMDSDDSEADAKVKVYRQETGGKPAMGAVHHHAKYGFCAYPAEYGVTGTFTFVVNENNVIFRFDNKGKPLLHWPSDHEARVLWPGVRPD